MQFPTWLVSKIRKPALVISIVVAMASILIACGGTANQAQTTTGETTNQAQTTSTVSFDDVMSAIYGQRQLSYNALQQIYTLWQNNAYQVCGVDYYGNAINYYDNNVASNFNQWLNNLANEAQNDQSLLNTTSDDQALISNALTANYAFTTWASQVYQYFTTPNNPCPQGQGQGGYLIATFPKDILPVSPTDFSWEEVLSRLPDVLQKLNDYYISPLVSGSVQQAIQQNQWVSSLPSQPSQQSLCSVLGSC